MNESVVRALRHPAAIPVLAAAAAFTNAFYLGYRYGKRKAERETLAVMDYVPEDPQLHFEFPPTGIADLSELAQSEDRDAAIIEAGRKVIETLSEPDQAVDEPTPVFERVEAFPEIVRNWDWEVEKRQREGEEVYILHENEYYGDELGFFQMTLTYYEGDDVLLDDHDTPIFDYKKKTGELTFGHGTKDPNVVYVRNVTYSAEYEILRHTGHYTVEVLGLEIESELEDKDLKHSDNHRLRRHEE